MVTSFSKPEAWVISSPGTTPFKAARSLTKEASSAPEDTVLIEVGVFCRSLARRPAVTTTSLSSVAEGEPPDGRSGEASASLTGESGAVATGASGADGAAVWAWARASGAITARQTPARRPDREPLLQDMTRSPALGFSVLTPFLRRSGSGVRPRLPATGGDCHATVVDQAGTVLFDPTRICASGGAARAAAPEPRAPGAQSLTIS